MSEASSGEEILLTCVHCGNDMPRAHNDKDHVGSCPMVTNFWPVMVRKLYCQVDHEQHEMMIGEFYRRIPMLPEHDEVYDQENIGYYRPARTRLICEDHAALRLVSGGLSVFSPAQAPDNAC